MSSLIVFDMDGVIFQHKDGWMETHKALGTLEAGRELTDKYLLDDFDRLVEEVVVKLWKGKDAQAFLDTIERAQYNPGVTETVEELRRRGYTIIILSAGPFRLVQRAMQELGIEEGYGNDLVIQHGSIAGRSHYDDGRTCFPIRADDKKPILKEVCDRHGVDLADVVFVGDGMSDYEAFKIVGKPIAFNDAPQELKELALERGGMVVEGKDLRRILDFL